MEFIILIMELSNCIYIFIFTFYAIPRWLLVKLLSNFFDQYDDENFLTAGSMFNAENAGNGVVDLLKCVPDSPSTEDFNVDVPA